MKTFVPFKNVISKLSLLVAVLISAGSSFSQVIPELVFDNAVLEAGTAGEDGAKYRFSNIAPGLDAVVEIKGRSSASVVLSSIDTSGPGLGYTKAFQPVLGIPGTAPANTTWSMNFRLIFYKAGTNNKIKISQFYVTGVDIDGDASTLSEWSEMDKITSIDSALVNSLTFTKLNSHSSGDDYNIQGIVANSPGIDTNAANVMASYSYIDKNQIDFTIGAKTNSLTTTAGMRLNSLWFRDFFNPVLPVKLMSFTAVLNNNKADLKWTTASEMNVSHFEVEKSTDGKNFNKTGEVTANGNTTEIMNYSFTDDIENTQSPVIFYRLKSVDIDEKAEFSETRIIRLKKQEINGITILTFPNPVSNELRITIPLQWQSRQVTYEVLNSNGTIAKKSITSASSQTETMNISNLAPGFYIVRTTCNDERAQHKIIKQ